MGVASKNFKRQAWVGTGTIILSMIVFGVAFYVLVGNIQKQADAISADRIAVANQSELINSYSNLKENIAASVIYQNAMDKILSIQDNLIAFPSQVGGVARNDGVDASFSFQGDPVPAGQTTAGYVNFKLNVTGSLSSITVFLRDLEASAPILLTKIDSFDLTASGPNYAVAVSGRVFFK